MVLEVKNLQKRYGELEAVRGISFSVDRGEIFGILGPNGAGKTTTLESIEGLLPYEEGEIYVLGKNNRSDLGYIKDKIGIQLQESSLPPRIKVWEALDLFSSFYKTNIDWRILLEKMNLAEKKNNYFSSLSGGQKQRLFVAIAMVNNPEILFLDEITTGLDPQARRHIWDVMKSVKNEGKTIVLSTHYMEEAEYLCDRLIIIDRGKIIAQGKPQELIDGLGVRNHLVIESEAQIDIDIFRNLKSISKVAVRGRKIEITGKDNAVLADVAVLLNKMGIRAGLQYRPANLEDVYLSLVGKSDKNQEEI